MIKKALKFLLLTALAYLLQATVPFYIQLFDVAPNLAIAICAIVTVAMGRKYAFYLSMVVGYLMEIMMGELTYMNLILYPVCCMMGALAFADKSERKLEEERSTGKKKVNLPAHLRTVLCALLATGVFEFVNVFYIYLNGVTIDIGHILRAMVDILYTAALAGLLQFPIRWWLGVYKLKRARA